MLMLIAYCVQCNLARLWIREMLVIHDFTHKKDNKMPYITIRVTEKSIWKYSLTGIHSGIHLFANRYLF